jgi:predicted metal-dependent hydrolase
MNAINESNETIDLGGLRAEVRRSARRKTVGLTVDRGGELVVHAPEAVALEDVQRWVQTKQLWVHQTLARKQHLSQGLRRAAPEFVTGESYSYLGRLYSLKLVREQDQPLRFDGARFLLRRDASPDALRLFRQWYVRTGSAWLSERIGRFTRRTGTSPERIDVRELHYRWGSCGRSGELHFNWRLLQLPVRFVDYVIVHELVHLAHPHHNADFWKQVELALPDWRERKARMERTAASYLVFGIPI